MKASSLLLAPTLLACRSRGETRSSQVQSPASHRSHSSSGRWKNTTGGGGSQASAALQLSELASRDCGPARLAALLRYRARARNANPGITNVQPNISVRHLVAVMASSQLMNPKTRIRIQGEFSLNIEEVYAQIDPAVILHSSATPMLTVTEPFLKSARILSRKKQQSRFTWHSKSKQNGQLAQSNQD
ncbi:hypothetical protein ACTXT7_000037 [Hymenolepis weldensis]